MSYVLIAIVILVVIFAKMALVIIPQSETRIIERLGRYSAHHSFHRPCEGHRGAESRTLRLLQLD